MRAVTQDTETSSHLQLDYDEDGNPQQLRFVYAAMSKARPLRYAQLRVGVRVSLPGRPARPERLIARGWPKLGAA